MKVNPYGWRLGYSSQPEVKWFSSFRDYPIFCQKVVVIERIIFKVLTETIKINLMFQNDGQVVISLLVPGLESVKKDALRKIKAEVEAKNISVNSIKADFLSKKEPNACWIAHEIRMAILKRENPTRIISHFLKLASNFTKIVGIRIELKGRFRAKNKTQKMIYKQGRLRLQSIETELEYEERLIIGKYGTSTVKVVVGYS